MLRQSRHNHLKLGGVEPSEPLWKRVPSRDENGKPVSDFRMIIKGLKSMPHREIQARIDCICAVLARYQDFVVFADLNLRINLLWVSVKANSQLDLEIAAEIHKLVPEAKLIAAMAAPRGH